MFKFAMLAIRADGLLYFMCNARDCIAHYKNQQRLNDEAQDPVRCAAVKRYVDALYDAGDLR